MCRPCARSFDLQLNRHSGQAHARAHTHTRMYTHTERGKTPQPRPSNREANTQRGKHTRVTHTQPHIHITRPNCHIGSAVGTSPIEFSLSVARPFARCGCRACHQGPRAPGRQASIQAGRHTSRHASKQAGRQANRQADKQAGRQTDIHTHTQTERWPDKRAQTTSKQRHSGTEVQTDRHYAIN